ncbi:hypothetical protein EVAR_71235_1 [Eumeta japonica]|uniref:Uncharacterized protein n=1 Tax=Eumeta variegata TaxID=151549 RepID=A0A4C1SJ88_EUMVA|nr:hypothetical protein EVAR_71235_1 [Eumeta japonica]
MCLRVCKGSSGAVAYQQTVLEIPGVVAVKLRHDVHLSASSHLFGMPGLWKAAKYARHGGVTWFIHTPWIWSTVRLGPRGSE